MQAYTTQTQTTSTSTYWPASFAGLNLSAISTFLTNPSISLVRVSKSDIHPHPPIKVVKPDWGHSSSTAASSESKIRATWLGHAVRHCRPPAVQPVVAHHFNTTSFFPQSFLVEFPRTSAGEDEEPPRVLFDPIFSDCVGPLPWLSIRRRLPPPCVLEELPEFQFVVYSHNQCVVRLATLTPLRVYIFSYDHLDLPTLQRIHELRGERVHFIVPLGEPQSSLFSCILFRQAM